MIQKEAAVDRQHTAHVTGMDEAVMARAVRAAAAMSHSVELCAPQIMAASAGEAATPM